MVNNKKQKLINYINNEAEMYIFVGIAHNIGISSEYESPVTIFKHHVLKENLDKFIDQYDDDLVLKAYKNINIEVVFLGDSYGEIQEGDTFSYL